MVEPSEYASGDTGLKSAADEIRALDSAYAAKWRVNSRIHTDQGDYSWMASRLDSLRPKTLLDIGIGDGAGLLELISRFRPTSVVGIEVNEVCLGLAASTLRRASPVTIHRRIERHPSASFSGVFDLEAVTPVSLVEGVNLIHTDISADPALSASFVAGSFDAVTVWLMGGNFSGRRYVSHHCLDGSRNSNQGYKFKIYDAAISLAAKLLRRGGELQIVDRLDQVDDDDLTEYVETVKRAFARCKGRTSGAFPEMDIDIVEYNPVSDPAGIVLRHEASVVEGGRQLGGDSPASLLCSFRLTRS